MNKGKIIFSLAFASLTGLASCGGNNTPADSSTSEPTYTYFSVALPQGEGFSAKALEGYDASKVQEGHEFRFEVKPLEGYRIASVHLDGETDVLLPNDHYEYTIPSVKGNRSVSAKAEKNTYPVAFEGENFIVVPVEGEQGEIAYGATFRFKVEPEAHNVVIGVSLMDTPLVPDETGVYSISNVTSKMTVRVATEEETYRLTLPAGEHFTLNFEDKDLDLAAIPYSKTVRFQVTPEKYYQILSVKLGDQILTPDASGFYSFAEKEGQVSLGVEAEIIHCNVTFHDLTSTSYPSQSVNAGTLLSKPADPVRAADDYYDSYTFKGWYNGTELYDFTKPVEGDMHLTARWGYGNQKKQYLDNWKREDFVCENGALTAKVNDAFSNICWAGDHIDTELKAQYLKEFARTDEDGMMFNPYGGSAKGSITFPLTDFRSLLSGGKVAKMELGGFNNWNNLHFKAGGQDILVNENREVQALDNLTRTEIYFYVDPSNRVRLYFRDRLVENPNKYAERYGEIFLTEEEASGKASISMYSNQVGGSRRYWMSRLQVVRGESTFLNVTNKSGLSVSNGALKTQNEATSEALANKEWTSAISSAGQAIGILGQNEKGSTTLNFNPIDFTDLFSQNQGIRFTLGSNLAGEGVYLGSGSNRNSLGQTGYRPDLGADMTPTTIQNTWYNFEVRIDSANVTVKNHAEQKDYIIPLDENIASGKKGLSFQLGGESAGHFYLLSHLSTFHY